MTEGSDNQRVGSPSSDYLLISSPDLKELTWIDIPSMLGACECREKLNHLKPLGVLVSAWLCALESFSLPWWDLCLVLASPWLLPITSGMGNMNGGVKKLSAHFFSHLLQGGKAHYKMS